MAKLTKKNSKIINKSKATKSKRAIAETKRVVEAIIDYRAKFGVKDKDGNRVYDNVNLEVEKKKADRLVWLENQRLISQTTPKVYPAIPSVEERIGKLHTENLSIEELMLVKYDLRNERVKELNKQLY